MQLILQKTNVFIPAALLDDKNKTNNAEVDQRNNKLTMKVGNVDMTG